MAKSSITRQVESMRPISCHEAAASSSGSVETANALSGERHETHSRLPWLAIALFSRVPQSCISRQGLARAPVGGSFQGPCRSTDPGRSLVGTEARPEWSVDARLIGCGESRLRAGRRPTSNVEAHYWCPCAHLVELVMDALQKNSIVADRLRNTNVRELRILCEAIDTKSRRKEEWRATKFLCVRRTLASFGCRNIFQQKQFASTRFSVIFKSGSSVLACVNRVSARGHVCFVGYWQE